MSQPDPFPQTTPPVESTSPTVNAGDVDNARTRILVGAPAVPEAPVAASAAAARFEVLRFHAKGGMGEVSVALDRELRREVAYKQIQPQFGADAEARRRFVLEAEVTGRLEHPGIVPVYGLGVQSDGRPYYAMRFIRGDSLRDAIRAFHAADTPGRKVGERELALRGLLRRFVDVCNAVAFAHDRGWLHRDLKPANVMLGKFGETLVVDWGLARPLRSDSGAVRAAESVFPPSSLADTTQETRQGDIVGTPPYMSPEQARGDWDAVGIRSDVYGLGAVLYELLSGKPPFAGSLSEVLEAVKAGQLVPVCQRKAGVPAALAAVVSKALALRREERYGTAQELAADVERWLADEPVTAYREPLSQQVRRWGRHHRVLVTGLAVLLLTLSVGLSVGLVVVNRYWRDTQEALRREEDARKAKAAALSNAQTQTANAMGIVKVVIGELNRGLAPYPNLQDLRLRLLHHAEKGLKKVLQEAGLDSLPIREQLAIHLEYGDLCLQLLDRGTELAREQYELAHVLAVRLAEADAENVEAQRDLSISHDRLGDMWLQLGNTKAALVAYQQALDVRRRLAEVDPRHAQREPDLAVSLGKLGDVRLQRGETELALDDYQQYHDICRRLVRADPKNVQAQRDLSVSLNKLGSVRLRRGDTKAALDAYQQSRDIAGRLAEADPMNAEAQRDLAASHANLGKVRLQLGDTKAALDA